MGLAYCVTASWWTPNLADWRSQELGSMGQLNHDDQITVGVTNKINVGDEEFVSKLLDRRWALVSPDTKIHQIKVSEHLKREQGGYFGDILFKNNPNPLLGDGMLGHSKDHASFYVVRDDLLHPLVNGNKTRKLDGLLPLLEDNSVTDVVTCGGCQSAHAAAVAVSCAERGLTSHLLLRGEQPETATGYGLISMLYGNATYVPRSLYAKRDTMLASHAEFIAESSGSVVWLSDLFEASFMNLVSKKPISVQSNAARLSEKIKKVAIINEGAGDAAGLLGVIRLVHYLSRHHIFGKDQALKVVLDSGTGTTAVGLGIAALCLGLPWEVTAVMLADTFDGYRNLEQRLVTEFLRCSSFPFSPEVVKKLNDGVVHWLERRHPRKFGNVLKGEVDTCQQIAQQTGILVDPIYTLAAWELSTILSQEEVGGAKVVMLHTGGTLGMFGLAQRYKSFFQISENVKMST
ncbi:hypothetical protein AgCh_001918 [Apium graveolens]